MTTSEAAPAGELGRIESLARQAGDEALARDAHDLLLRLEEGRFHLAVLGQFKRGKSTLLNALLGTPLLPMGVIPVTAIPAVIRFGPSAARVRTAAGDWEPVSVTRLADYVSESGNPGNQKRVTAVEVFAPHPLLAGGLCLVDTPGIGSTFEANSLAARAFIPQVDAALIVLGTDPPITLDELRLVEEVGRQVADIVFVLNKWDRLDPIEREEARVFTARVLSEQLHRLPGPLLGISALAALEGVGDSGDWQLLVDRLTALGQGSARQSVLWAVARRGVVRVAGQLRHLIQLELDALQRPLEETERRIGSLRALQQDTERDLADLKPLLTAEEHRLADAFRERREDYVARVSPGAHDELGLELDRLAARAGRLRRADALDAADAIAEGRLRGWLRESESEALRAYRESLRRFVEMVQRAGRRLAEESGLGDPLPDLTSDGSPEFTTPREFAFTHLLTRHRPLAPLVWLGDWVLPRRIRQRAIRGAAERYLADLLFVNASRVEGDLTQRVRESRRTLEARLRRALDRAARAAEAAADRARTVRAEGSARVAARRAELETMAAELEAGRADRAG